MSHMIKIIILDGSYGHSDAYKGLWIDSEKFHEPPSLKKIPMLWEKSPLLTDSFETSLTTDNLSANFLTDTPLQIPTPLDFRYFEMT